MSLQLAISSPAEALGKVTGEGIYLYLVIRHKGDAAVVQLDWEIAPGDGIPGVYHWDRAVFVLRDLGIQLGQDTDWKEYSLQGLVAQFPSIEPLNTNRFDCRVSVWDNGTKFDDAVADDVYFRSDLEPAEFELVGAAFS